MAIRKVIIDQDNSLGQAKRRQLENVLDLHLSRFADEIRCVKFRVIQTSNERYGCEHYVLLMIVLCNGKALKVRVTRYSVDAAIIVAVEAGQQTMVRRERFKNWFPIRFARQLRTGVLNWFNKVRLAKALNHR